MDWRSGPGWGASRADQRLAALARRPSALLPQRPGHPGLPAAIRAPPPATIPASWRAMPRASSSRVVDAPRAGRRGVRRVTSRVRLQALCPVSAAAVPWLIAVGLRALAVRGWPATVAVAARPGLRLDRLPDQLRGVRDAAVLPGIPLGLVATRRLRALPVERRTPVNWLVATGLMSLAVLVHLTTAMVVAPAAAARLRRSRSAVRRAPAVVDDLADATSGSG